jgi:hypothetical protein
MGAERLPAYRGRLKGAAWSQIELTQEVEAALRHAALRSCPVCGGKGHIGGPPTGQPCHCVNRPVEGTGPR